MEVRKKYYNNIAILSPSGRLDYVNIPILLQALNEQISANYVRLVVDLKKVEFVNSIGIKVLVQATQLARQQGGDIRLAHAQMQVKYILNLAGVDSVIKVYPNVVGATASYFAGPIPER